ncbi:CST complex subunit TEN1 isoform X1 [Myotis myotis]|uniref:CST complex subunit TEN1 isoform X1 n=1 Tax=Myotis myotis TaxID=51298 RepID=UPI00174871A2|nr:CST complex subunit TEN1 isoform X1 [Myotis myotis]
MTLPKPGTYYFPWELSAGQAPDGGALRTFGRLSLCDMAESRATLTAQHGSEQHQVLVCTKLVEPFQAQVGSLYLVLGELEQQQAALWNDAGPRVSPGKAQASRCSGGHLPADQAAGQRFLGRDEGQPSTLAGDPDVVTRPRHAGPASLHPALGPPEASGRRRPRGPDKLTPPPPRWRLAPAPPSALPSAAAGRAGGQQRRLTQSPSEASEEDRTSVLEH